MKDKRILYVSSEVVPYLAENEVSLMSYDVPKDGQRSRRAN
jgi:starch synthase